MALLSLTAARTNARAMLDEAAVRFWPDAQLNVWLNEGARSVARQAECLFDRQTINGLASTQEYPLRTDTIRVYRAVYQPVGTLQEYPLEYRDWNNLDSVWGANRQVPQSYTPTFFTMWGFPPNLMFNVYPIPSSTGLYTIYYYRLPKDAVADTDLLEVPEGWYDLLALFCEYMGKRKDADPTWQEAKGLYDERLSELVTVTRRFSDQSGGPIQMAGSVGGLPSWLVGGTGEDFY